MIEPVSVIEPVEMRLYQPADVDPINDICVRTAERGGDAPGLYSSDELMPDIFVRPHAAYAPDLAFVVEWYSREWLPGFAEKHIHVLPHTNKNEMITHLGFWPERMLIPEVDLHPAHLHIDLLSRLQGRGFGRQLIETLKSELRARRAGAPPDAGCGEHRGARLLRSSRRHGAALEHGRCAGARGAALDRANDPARA